MEVVREVCNKVAILEKGEIAAEGYVEELFLHQPKALKSLLGEAEDELLPQEGTFYKANLHCHSTLSDGRLTPEELKEHYKANGYSVLAYTDHDMFIPHHELTDESFVALAGFEARTKPLDKARFFPRNVHRSNA